MNILILGHAQHGKDELALIVGDVFRLNFFPSSDIMFDVAIWPGLQALNMYQTRAEALADKHAQRPLWKKLASDFNTPDKSRLTREILAFSDIRVGIRCEEEYAADKNLFDLILWVHRFGKPAEATMTIKFNPAEMTPVVNYGPLENMKRQVQKIFINISEK